MKTFSLEPTKLKELFRIVDRNGDWQNYWHKKTNTVLRSVNAILDAGYPKGKGYEIWLSKLTPAESEEIRKEKSGEGDRTHQFIDAVLTSSGVAGFGTKFSRDETLVLDKDTGQMVKLNDEEWGAVLSWAEFWNRHEPTLLLAEIPVYDLKLGYAGTFDAALILTKACEVKSCGCDELVNKLGIYDWKKSAGIYPNYSAQLGGYALAESLKGLLGGRGLDYAANVRLGTNHKTTGGYEFKAYTKLGEIKNAFLTAKFIANRDYKPFTMEEVEEIPDTISVEVKREELKKDGKPKTTNKTKH